MHFVHGRGPTIRARNVFVRAEDVFPLCRFRRRGEENEIDGDSFLCSAARKRSGQAACLWMVRRRGDASGHA